MIQRDAEVVEGDRVRRFGIERAAVGRFGIREAAVLMQRDAAFARFIDEVESFLGEP